MTTPGGPAVLGARYGAGNKTNYGLGLTQGAESTNYVALSSEYAAILKYNNLKANFGKLLAWLFVGACAIINVMLLRSTVELPTLSGAGAAQADLGLYLVLKAIGIPVVILSVVAIAVTLFARDRSKRLAGVLRYNYGIVTLALVNILIPLGILYWLTVVWKQ